jgi:hypothetical protein
VEEEVATPVPTAPELRLSARYRIGGPHNAALVSQRHEQGPSDRTSHKTRNGGRGVSGEGKSIESGGVRPDVQVRRQGAARPDHPHPRPGQGVSRLLPGQRRHEVLRPPATRRILSVERRLLTDQADALRRAELFAGQLVESDDAPGEHLKKKST